MQEKKLFGTYFEYGKLTVFFCGIKFTLNFWKRDAAKRSFVWQAKNFLAGIELEEFLTVDKYKKLIKNLVENSACIISRTFEKLRATKVKIPLTKDELAEYNSIYEKFTSRIFKVNDDCYAYGKYLLPKNQFELNVFYYRHGLDEISNKEILKNKSVIDVGGYMGESALVLSEITNSKVYTFEPTTGNYALLEKTLMLNGISNIVPVKKALGKSAYRANITVCNSGSTMVANARVNECVEEIEVITLDSFVEEYGIDVGLIKVDIEGAEKDFLIGAKKTICEQKPVLLLSIYHSLDDYVNLKLLIESWNLGYSFKVYHPNLGNIVAETLLICEVI